MDEAVMENIANIAVHSERCAMALERIALATERMSAARGKENKAQEIAELLSKRYERTTMAI